MFLLLMVIGLVGLAAAAIPAFAHGHAALSGHGVGGAGSHGFAHAPNITATRGATTQLVAADPGLGSAWRFVPSPRAVFSVLALYGAFGNACIHAFHLPSLTAALVAAPPALLLEWLVVRRLWGVLFRVQGAECTPLDQLVLTEARAVIRFRNGRGIVATVRDGRQVQLVATLTAEQRAFPVKVGDRLVIESVDAARERVTVTLARD